MFNSLLQIGRRFIALIKEIPIKELPFFDTFDRCCAAFDIYLTLNSIRDLWSEEFIERYSFKTRMGILCFYILHLALLCITTGAFHYLVGYLFGAQALMSIYMVSISTASLLSNLTTLANNLFETVQEKYYNFKRKREKEKLIAELGSSDIDYEQNALFLNDFNEQKDEIDLLEAQQGELVILLSHLDGVQELTDSDDYMTQVEGIAKVIKDKCDAINNEETAVHDFYKKNGNNIDEQKVISDTYLEVKLIQEYKKDIQKAINDLYEQGNDISSEVKLYKNHLESLDAKIKNCAAINKHFYKIIKAKASLVETDAQLASLDNKYLTEPYCYYDPIERDQIKQIEKSYLLQRRTDLNNFILQPIQPKAATRLQAKTDIRLSASIGSQILGGRQNKQSLKGILTTQIATLENMIGDAKKSYEKKKEFLQTITSDPNHEINHDFDKISEILNKINTIDKAIKLSDEKEKHNLWSTYISICSASAAIFFSYFSSQVSSVVAETITRVLTLISTTATIYSRREIFQAQIHQANEERAEAAIIKDKLYSKAELLSDPAMRGKCIERMNSISKNLERDYPLAAHLAANDPVSATYLPRGGPQRGRKASPKKMPKSSPKTKMAR